MVFGSFTFLQFAALIGAWVSSSVVIYWLISLGRSRYKRGSKPAAYSEKTVFMFQDGELVDATDRARLLHGLTEPVGNDLQRLIFMIEDRYPGLDNAVSSLHSGQGEVRSKDGKATISLHKDAPLLRLEIRYAQIDKEAAVADHATLSAAMTQLTQFRDIWEKVPLPIWRQSQDGNIIWANATYRNLQATVVGPANRHAPMFKEPVHLMADDGKVQRAKLTLAHEAEPRWFEFAVTLLDDDILVVANPVDRLIRAERSLHDFVQTLTQTFAHLDVGLAIFTRSRELAIFNPALVDLLGLPPEFLIKRPALFELFDALREKRMVPEPKDFKSWRQQLVALEAAATDTIYSETWSLVDGRTYRVTGRPHSEGAIAFLFEDISAEITLERRFRSELQVSQAIINGLPEAVAVFSPAGEMSSSNKAYEALWGEPSLNTSMIEATRVWQEACSPTPIWGDARDFASTLEDRSNWTGEVRMKDSRRLSCRFEALPGGHTLIAFQEVQRRHATKTRKSPKSLSA